MIKDLEACDCKAMSRSQYEKKKPLCKVIAVSVNDFVGARPSGGVVIFANKFSKNPTDWDLGNNAIRIDWFHGMNPSLRQMVYDGPGTEDFRERLRKVLLDQDRLSKNVTKELWRSTE